MDPLRLPPSRHSGQWSLCVFQGSRPPWETQSRSLRLEVPQAGSLTPGPRISDVGSDHKKMVFGIKAGVVGLGKHML